MLYLVPACLGSSLLCAFARGELKELFEYSEEEEEEEEEEEAVEGEGGGGRRRRRTKRPRRTTDHVKPYTSIPRRAARMQENSFAL